MTIKLKVVLHIVPNIEKVPPYWSEQLMEKNLTCREKPFPVRSTGGFPITSYTIKSNLWREILISWEDSCIADHYYCIPRYLHLVLFFTLYTLELSIWSKWPIKNIQNERKSEQAHISHAPTLLENAVYNEWQFQALGTGNRTKKGI